jgi:hypothetical protein
MRRFAVAVVAVGYAVGGFIGAPAFCEPPAVKPTAAPTVAPLTSEKSGVLSLVEITPEPKCEQWDYYTTCDPKTGAITAKTSSGSATYNWTPPPDRMGAEGCTLTMSASEQTAPSAPVATGLNINAGSLTIDPPGATVAIGAKGQPLNQTITVRLSPPQNPSGDYYLKIGVYDGPGFTYHYRAQR